MNEKLFLLINSYVGKIGILDLTGVLISQYMPYLFIVAEVYIYFYLKRKNEAIFAFYSMLTALLINKIVGIFYFHNRPFMDGIGISLIRHSAENSFPSDHTTFMMSIALSLLTEKNVKKSALILLFLGLIGGLSRIYVGVHYPLDIIGSIFTSILGVFVIRLLKKRLQKLNDTVFRIENRFSEYII